MSKITKFVIAPILVVIVVFAFFMVFSYFYLQDSLPQYSGEIESHDITAEIEIYRDSLAVPYILAKNEIDAAFALGFVHAQERLFQMDIMRRAGEGRLSEIIGAKTVPFDKMFRTLGLFTNVQNSISEYDHHTMSIIESYTRGINYFINKSNTNLPIEFNLLGYEPEPWIPEHSLVIGKLLAWELNISWWTDLAFSHLVEKLGPKKVEEILPDYPENDPYIITENSDLYSHAPIDLMETDKKFREFIGFMGTHIGSNNWVVNGAKSLTGKSIIANDPHLALQIPGKWYVAVIRSPEWNVEGFTLPGVPAVIIGKNQNISWVVTNVMADDADFYVETLNEEKTEYLLDGNWIKLNTKNDTIVVKDSTDVIFKIRENHRGPIVSEVHPYNTLYPDSIQQKVTTSMRWTALDFTEEFSAILGINKSTNWNQFNKALEKYSVPGQNFVYADTEGNIGYVCAAKLTKRNNNSPTLIYNGTTTENDWTDYIPFKKMPRLFNPSKNYIASANNKTIREFEHHITNLWEPSSRITRIDNFLSSKEKHSSEDYKKYQNDFYSHYAERITPHILKAFENSKINDKNLRTSLELIKQWDYVISPLSQTPSIFLTFYQKLLENIFLDEMGESLFKEYVFIANIPYRVIDELLEKDYSPWFNNILTEQLESKNFIIRKSLGDALTFLEQKYGNDLSQWSWGKLHTITFKHMFHGQSVLIDNLLDEGPYPIGGDGTTVFNTEYSFTEPFENKLGPSMRFIYDFSKPDEFEFVLPTGQSGNPVSNNYRDMTTNWLNGKYYSIKTDEKSIKSGDNQKLLIKTK